MKDFSMQFVMPFSQYMFLNTQLGYILVGGRGGGANR